MTAKKGFTLTEVLIVVVIVGVLASLALPRMTGHQEKAKVSEAVNMLSAMRMGEKNYTIDHGGDYLALDESFPETQWNRVGLSKPDMTDFDYEFNNINGVGTATRKSSDAAYNHKTITLNEDGVWGGSHPYRPKN